MPIQQMLLGAGAVATKTYVDDIFSTYLWAGSGSARSINNGINLSESGGMTWIKKRSSSDRNVVTDTVRGVTKQLFTERTDGNSTDSTNVTAFNNNGFSLGTHNRINQSGATYTSWSFLKSKGFFTICEWTGNATNRLISHDLGCIPGLILIKRTDVATDWMVYHKSLNGGTDPGNYRLHLNTTVGEAAASTVFNNTEPTSTTFSIGSHYDVNGNNGTFVAYLFAGGESTAATARSVGFDGNDFLSFANTSDFVFGTGAYTVEFWIKPDTTPTGNIIFSAADTNGFVINMDADSVNINKYSVGDVVSSTSMAPVGQWTHYAFVREGTGSNQTKIYVNGQLDKTGTDANDWTVNANWGLGARNSDGNYGVEGKISNFRIVKGTAVYTSSFRPPTEPLTNITNTKLLCCNHSSQAGSTVTPVVITSNGNSVASTDSPFDEPAGFAFGDAGDQNVIKCGSYVGNGNADGPDVFLGWEPQWLMVKRVDSADEWPIYDSMRGIVTGGNDYRLYANQNAAEYSTNTNYFALTPTGFKVSKASGEVNASGGTYIYFCIRRPDGYVGKPPELGTDVFSLARGAGNPSFPCFVTGFPVDFLLQREFASADSWSTGARLTGTEYMYTNANDAGAGTNYDWGSNTGAVLDRASSYQGWLWKRYAGFDVVTWAGINENVFRRHNLGKTPEMIIFKNRDAARSWRVYHKGLNGGTNPEDYAVALNGNSAEGSGTTFMNSTAPTSTHFVSGLDGDTNAAGDNYIALLFASVDGISKVGYFDGSNSDLTITTGFQPRFLIVKAASTSGHWNVLDTTRGWASGNDPYLKLNANSAENSGYDNGVPTATGFTLAGNNGGFNVSGVKYIYYCHA